MEKLAKSMDYLKISMGVSDTPPAAERVFDASFLPPLEERKIK